MNNLTDVAPGLAPSAPRRITAQRGTTLRCKSWKQEVILRMLENNLEIGERPEDLVVYMSAARAARDWKSFDLIVAALKDLGDSETLVVQSGKPIARFSTHPRAPRVIMANGNVLGHWADNAGFHRLEQMGLTVVPGMTAAAWQYIGSQGILQGTYQSFAGAADLYFGGSLSGRTILSAGCGGMSGAQPLAGKMAGAATLVVEADQKRLLRRMETGYLDTMTGSIDDALAAMRGLQAAGNGGSVGLHGNAADVYESLLTKAFVPDIVTDQCMVDPYRGYVPSGLTAEQAAALVRQDPGEALRRAGETLARHARAILEFRRRGAIAFEYGNQFRSRAAEAGVPEALQLDSFVTLFIRPYFCKGIGPFRWIAASGAVADIAAADEIIGEQFETSHPIHRWIDLAQRYVRFQGLPARIGWLGHTERSRLAVAVNDAVAGGRISAPIAFTRDHLDAGSVASPFRETEDLRDGSDPIADWPLLNAMLACSTGADLVAIHANTNKSQSAGQTAIADGSSMASQRLKAVLDGDTGIGIARMADAGYDVAQQACADFGVGLAGSEGPDGSRG